MTSGEASTNPNEDGPILLSNIARDAGSKIVALILFLVTEAKNGALSSLVQAARAAHANPKIRRGRSDRGKKRAKKAKTEANRTMTEFLAKSATSKK